MWNDTERAPVPRPPAPLPAAPEEVLAPANGRPAAAAETALDRKQAVLRDVVGAVADGGLLGAYVWGRPGTGKSFLVRDELERRETRYVFTQGHATAKGLFQLLRRHPDALHVLDDVESAFRYVAAVEILRAALASQGRIVHGRDFRAIKWISWNRPTPDEFIFTGRVIGLGNLPFPDGPAQDGLRSRSPYLHFVVSDVEVIEMMRKLAHQGYKSVLGPIDPMECSEVAEFVIKEFLALSRPLDLRAYFKALEIYAPWSLGRTRCHWHDLVRSLLWEYLCDGGEIVSREELVACGEKEDALLREILARDCGVDEQLRLWQAATKGPKSRATFFRRKKVVEAGHIR
jgi:hypothetical protein